MSMKKFFVCALLASLLAAVPAFAKKSYVNGIDPNYPPFAYMDEKTGQAAGFDVDSLNWIYIVRINFQCVLYMKLVY